MQQKTVKKATTPAATDNKGRDCIFMNVVDPIIKKQIKEAVQCPEDATLFTFWFRKSSPTKWGLTTKSSTKGNNQYVWKYSWFLSDDEDCLLPTTACGAGAKPVVGDFFEVVKAAYLIYAK